MLSNLDGVLCVLSLSVWENKIEFNKMSVTRQCWGPLGGTLDQKVQNFVIFYSSSSPSLLPSPTAKIWGWVPDFQNRDHHHLIQHDNDHQQQHHHITSWIPPAPVYHLESESKVETIVRPHHFEDRQREVYHLESESKVAELERLVLRPRRTRSLNFMSH